MTHFMITALRKVCQNLILNKYYNFFKVFHELLYNIKLYYNFFASDDAFHSK